VSASIRMECSWVLAGFSTHATSGSNLRLSQYELLYSPWSEQVHAAPGALIDSCSGTGGQVGKSL
jgi:hypothetical protein